MIRLFRKIRHQLLSEDKYSIYLLYAAGEIFLVVIGILLALQIDNWNEERKLARQRQELEQSLKADLVQDTLLIGVRLELIIEDTLQLHDIVLRMSDDAVNLDTLIRIARYEFDPWIHADMSFNKNTFTSLLSTGDINQLNPWLQEALLELNKLQAMYTNSVELDTRSTLDQFIHYNQSYPFNDRGHIHADSRLSDLIWDEVQFRELARALNSVVALKYVTYLGSINTLKEIQLKTMDVLEKLQ